MPRAVSFSRVRARARTRDGNDAVGPRNAHRREGKKRRERGRENEREQRERVRGSVKDTRHERATHARTLLPRGKKTRSCHHCVPGLRRRSARAIFKRRSSMFTRVDVPRAARRAFSLPCRAVFREHAPRINNSPCEFTRSGRANWHTGTRQRHAFLFAARSRETHAAHHRTPITLRPNLLGLACAQPCTLPERLHTLARTHEGEREREEGNGGGERGAGLATSRLLTHS